MAGLAACVAAPPVDEVPGASVELLSEAPKRPFETVAQLEVRGAVGANRAQVYRALRAKAHALGADAVLHVEERAATDAAPAPYGPPDRPLLGNAYPGPLHALEPGAFPPGGSLSSVRGRYLVLEGRAIRYLD